MSFKQIQFDTFIVKKEGAKMARIRTISETAIYIKTMDPDTTIGEWYIRKIIKSGKLKCHRAGNRFLVDLDRLEEYLANPPEEIPIDEVRYGRLRKIH